MDENNFMKALTSRTWKGLHETLTLDHGAQQLERWTGKLAEQRDSSRTELLWSPKWRKYGKELLRSKGMRCRVQSEARKRTLTELYWRS